MYKFLYKNFCQNLERYTRIQIRSKAYENIRLDKFISQKFELNWNIIQKHFRKSDVFIIRGDNSNKLKSPDEKLQLGDEVFISRIMTRSEDTGTANPADKLAESDRDVLLDLLSKMTVFSNKDFIILDKLCNLSTQGGTSLKFSIDTLLLLKNQLHKNKNLKLIHRLDRNVTGLMIVGKDISFVRAMGDDLKQSKVEKIYLTLVQDLPMYLKQLISANRAHPANADQFNKCLSGLIKSNENGDMYVIEMNNNSQFISNDDGVTVTKQNKLTNVQQFEMIGRFKITHLVYYDKNTKIYTVYNFDEISRLNDKEKEKYLQHFEKIMTRYDKKLEGATNQQYECFSVVLYELISGKKHQIRKHMGRTFMTPIFNDEEYLFDKDLSRVTYGSFFEKFDNKGRVDEESLMDRYKISHYLQSVLLHSIQITLPYKSEGGKYNSKRMLVRDDGNKTTFKNLNLPDNFSHLFSTFHSKRLLEYFTNKTNIIKF
jgi:23S rRNA-/tRNA-specific pseudouridylate synthase